MTRIPTSDIAPRLAAMRAAEDIAAAQRHRALLQARSARRSAPRAATRPGLVLRPVRLPARAVLSWAGLACIVAVLAFSFSWAVTYAVLDHHGGSQDQPSQVVEAKYRATRM